VKLCFLVFLVHQRKKEKIKNDGISKVSPDHIPESTKNARCYGLNFSKKEVGVVEETAGTKVETMNKSSKIPENGDVSQTSSVDCDRGGEIVNLEVLPGTSLSVQTSEEMCNEPNRPVALADCNGENIDNLKVISEISSSVQKSEEGSEEADSTAPVSCYVKEGEIENIKVRPETSLSTQTLEEGFEEVDSIARGDCNEEEYKSEYLDVILPEVCSPDQLKEGNKDDESIRGRLALDQEFVKKCAILQASEANQHTIKKVKSSIDDKEGHDEIPIQEEMCSKEINTVPTLGWHHITLL